jgi:hypothetical protein
MLEAKTLIFAFLHLWLISNLKVKLIEGQKKYKTFRGVLTSPKKLDGERGRREEGEKEFL